MTLCDNRARLCPLTNCLKIFSVYWLHVRLSGGENPNIHMKESNQILISQAGILLWYNRPKPPYITAYCTFPLYMLTPREGPGTCTIQALAPTHDAVSVPLPLANRAVEGTVATIVTKVRPYSRAQGQEIFSRKESNSYPENCCSGVSTEQEYGQRA